VQTFKKSSYGDIVLEKLKPRGIRNKMPLLRVNGGYIMMPASKVIVYVHVPTPSGVLKLFHGRTSIIFFLGL
jgi:hypothetical protein